MRKTEKRLRERVKALEEQVEKLKADREIFREHFVSRFKWWIKLLGGNEQPSIQWLIESDAKYLRRLESWYW